MNPIQGQSRDVTPTKQEGLIGMYDLFATMRKNHFKPVAFVDLFSGEGKNHVGGTEINGSPISLLDGLKRSFSKMNTLPKGEYLIIYGDIVAGRVLDRLPIAVESWCKDNAKGYSVFRRVTTGSGCSEAGIVNRDGTESKIVSLRYFHTSAEQSIEGVRGLIESGYHVVATIDPNGVKDVPWERLRDLFDGGKSSDLELIIHISSNVLKRVSKSKDVTGNNVAPYPDHIQGLLDHFKGAGGWIREPVGSDQWTMLLLSKYPPRNGWNVKGGKSFYLLDSEEGRGLVRYLSLTKKERKGLKV